MHEQYAVDIQRTSLTAKVWDARTGTPLVEQLLEDVKTKGN
jgi:hypothetical protein